MSNKFSNSLKKGFTLLEILIVIAIIGILSVGLLATLDPIEQIRRGTDSATQQVTTDYFSAATRFYAIQQRYPWSAALPAAPTDQVQVLASVAPNIAAITALVTAGELKSTFAQAAVKSLPRIFVTATTIVATGEQTVIMCFLPDSKGMRSDVNSRFTNAGGAAAGCPSAALTTCHWCISG